MTILMQREFDKLKKGILTVSALTEEHVNLATKAVIERNESYAHRVIENDSQINTLEIEVEEECLKILALHQPVAADLRFIVAILKINNDLERVGDLAANVSESALALIQSKPIEIPFDLQGMAEIVKEMVSNSLDSLINLDVKKAEEILKLDDEVDKIHKTMYSGILSSIHEHTDTAPSMIHLLSVSKNLERIADLATNIAQDIIYLINGVIVRHGGIMGEEQEASTAKSL